MIACTTPNITYRVDIESKQTLLNLVTRSNLECAGLADSKSVSFLGSAFFLGTIVSFILWVKAVDLGLARKPIIIMGAAFQNSGYAAILFFPLAIEVL